jgi:hypothetical protein
MKHFRFTVFVLLIAVLLFSLTMPVLAQEDVTPVPTADEGGIPVEVPDGTDVVVVQPPAQDVTSPLLSLAAVIFVTVAGGGTVVLIVSRLLESREARDQSEKLFQSTSPETQAFIRELVSAGHKTEEFFVRLLDFMDAISDGKPNSEEVARISAQQARQVLKEYVRTGEARSPEPGDSAQTSLGQKPPQG